MSLELHINSEVIEVAKVGPDRIMLKQPRLLPDGDAKLVIKVGEATTRTHVFLNGGNGDDGTVRYW